jgi:retinol dehydrogenase-12
MARRSARAPIDADLGGRVAVVTGASAGIGEQTAGNLARLGAHVVMACRSRARGEAARARQVAAGAPEDRLELHEVELSSRASVRGFAAALAAAHPAIDILVNNAGIYPASRALSEDGVELTWATNVLAYEQVTDLLLDRLRAAARPGRRARIVYVASLLAGGLAMDDLEWTRRRFGGVAAYKQSKQANRMLAWARAERLSGEPVSLQVCHPGGVASNIHHHQTGVFGALVRLQFKLLGTSLAQGADTPTWLAASPELEAAPAALWAKRRARPCEFRDDLEACRALDARCQAMLAG